MKRIILILIGLTIIYGISNAQCDCETIQRADSKIVQCNPKQIASDNTTQVGIALASNGQDNFITVTVRFKNSASKISDKLHLRLVNNQLLSFELVNSGLAYIGDSDVANVVYQIESEQVVKLKSSKLSTISLSMNHKMYTFQCNQNLDTIIKQIECL